MATTFDFTLNGETRRVVDCSPTLTVLSYLRHQGLTGTKEGCAEGDCGACTIALVDTNVRGEPTYRAINSCIALLPMLAGRVIWTVEGLAQKGHLHPVQTAMATGYGSQCGYCTPGFVVSMFEAYYRDDLGEGAARLPVLTDQLCGNLCRCTGYRPIRDAMLEALDDKARGCPNLPPGDDLFQISLRKPAEPIAELALETQGGRFLRPTTLAGLLTLRAEHPDAVLVAGATEIGVEVNKKAKAFPFLVSTEGVAELTAVTKNETAFFIGGAATLTTIEDALAREIPALDKMLLVFASRQIRNRATLAGNLVTASPIGDLAPCLLALDASVVLASVRGERNVPLDEFFVGYRKTVMQPDEIVKTIVIPRVSGEAAARRRCETYKVSKRREMDISIVAAAFCLDLSPKGLVERARLAYGGVAATPVRARQTEAYLVGKPLDEATVAGARLLLADEFTPIDDVRSKRAYRRGLIVSLFDKLLSGEQTDSQDKPLAFTVGSPWKVDDESRGLAHESAMGHVTGAAQYVDDVAMRREMLEMWPVTVPHAHARILRLDTSAAETMPGVVTILVPADIAGRNDTGAIRHDEPLLATDLVSFHGQMVAVVVGRSYEECRAAAAKVVVECEPLVPILGIEHAIEVGSYHTNPHVIARGDVDGALSRSPRRLTGELTIGGQEHFYLEAQAAWAETGDDGDVRISSSTQHPSEVQAIVSHVLDLPRHKVVVEAPRMGGGFGGKETQGAPWAALCALAAKKTGKPVRVQLDRDLDLIMTGKRHPFLGRFEVGYGDDGRVLGAKVELTSDGGFALDLSESIADRALFHLDNAYFLPEVRFQSRVAKTNTVSHTAFRGFGGPQGMVVMEEILDRIARSLDLPPEVVRERNLYRGTGESNRTHYGQDLGDERIPAIWTALVESSDLASRRAEIRAFNAQSPWVKRGIAITPVKFGISFTATFLNQAGALVLIYRDGTVQVNHGGTEMGQGLYTKIRGIAMRELGVPASMIRVMKTITDKVPNTSATAASSGSDLNGQAVRDACAILRERLVPVAQALAEAKAGGTIAASPVFGGGAKVLVGAHELTFAEVVEKAYLSQVSLATTGFYRTPGIGYDRVAGKGKPFYYFSYGAAVSEVEIDGYSGMKRLLRTDILQDCGESLNPGVDRGQIEGAFVQGVGWLTGEELLWDDQGRLLSHSASTYQIPAISDAPIDLRVALLPHAAQDGVIHGSKAVGEPPLMLAISVREAIRDAVAAFGGQGPVALPCPATHEAIYAAIRTRREGALGTATLKAEDAAE